MYSLQIVPEEEFKELRKSEDTEYFAAWSYLQMKLEPTHFQPKFSEQTLISTITYF